MYQCNSGSDNHTSCCCCETGCGWTWTSILPTPDPENRTSGDTHLATPERFGYNRCLMTCVFEIFMFKPGYFRIFSRWKPDHLRPDMNKCKSYLNKEDHCLLDKLSSHAIDFIGGTRFPARPLHTGSYFNGKHQHLIPYHTFNFVPYPTAFAPMCGYHWSLADLQCLK